MLTHLDLKKDLFLETEFFLTDFFWHLLNQLWNAMLSAAGHPTGTGVATHCGDKMNLD